MLFEGLAEERALDRFANDILIYVSECLLKNNEYGIYKRENDDYYRIYSNVFVIKPNTLVHFENYSDSVKNFIIKSGIRIFFTTETQESGTKGYYIAPNNIFLVYQIDDFKDIWQMLNGKYISFGDHVLTKVENLDIYSKLFYKFQSTILHELKHAYDYYVSKGNLTNSKRWRKHVEILKNLPQDVTKRTFTDMNRKTTSYLKLPHEISARFSQALGKITFDKYDDTWTDRNKKDFKDVFKDFKIKFENWNVLTDQMKRILIKRLYKYWDEFEVKNDN